MEDTKQRILEKSLELFSTKGYDAVSVGEIAKAVGIKAPSLYNHFPSKQAIFDAILETTSAHYQKDTAEISVHVQDSQKDIPVFSHISEELLVEKVRQIFLYSLHDKTISQFRRIMTLEQFRSPKFAELLSKRYIDWMISYHAGIFRALVANGELRNEDPDTLAWMGAETNPPGSPILCPIFTLSPTATIGLQGAPMCIDMGMTTSAGAASCSMAFSLVAAFMSLG